MRVIIYDILTFYLLSIDKRIKLLYKNILFFKFSSAIIILMKKILLSIFIYLVFSGCTLTNLNAKGTKNKKITILEQVTLEYEPKNEIAISEISDLSYDKKNHRLYMIGDKGFFYVFSATFKEKIKNLKYINAFKIREKKGQKKYFDSEGLALNNKNELLVSFERKPRISKLSRDGLIVKEYKIPRKLKSKKIYKNSNSMFEALAFHPRYGILTVAEYPIKKRKNTQQTIYALNGKEWHFKAEAYKNSAVTAIEVMEDNNILVLERSYSGITQPFIVTLKKVFINKCNKKQKCKSEVLASFNSFEGWGINNFEGLAKVGKNRFLMVSDNNNRSFLDTVLIYFEVNEL